jgi:CubicO group peptidase (beta-lactamase class C family)
MSDRLVSGPNLSRRKAIGSIAGLGFASIATPLWSRTVQLAPTGDTKAAVARIARGLLPKIVCQHTMPREIESRMDEFVVPGVSVAAFRQGRIEWQRCWGTKRVGAGEPVAPDTLFQAASISKSIAAVAAMRLVRDGKLRLDDDVLPFVRGWAPPSTNGNPPASFTLRQLLSHTAGLPNHSHPGYVPGAPLPTVAQILSGAAPAHTEPVEWIGPAGAVFEYSNAGYSVLQLAIEGAAGEPFGLYAKRTVLDPAGMHDSTFDQPLPTELARRAAVGTIAGAEVPGGCEVYPNSATGGLWTTPADLARFAIKVQSAYTGDDESILSRDEARAMLARQVGGWGLGFELGGGEKPTLFGHRGVNTGFESVLSASIRQGYGIAVLANAAGGMRLADELIRAAAIEYGWSDLAPRRVTAVAVPAAGLDGLTGYFEADGEAAYFERQGTSLAARFRAPAFERMIALGDGAFINEDGRLEARFVTGADPLANSVQLVADGPPITARRTPPPLSLVKSGDLFVRGSMNDWQATSALEEAGEASFAVTIPLPVGRHEFKIADPTWGTHDYGAWSATPLVLGERTELAPAGVNALLEAPYAGGYCFTVDLSNPARPYLTVTAL